MPRSPAYTDHPEPELYSEIIDVRSPSEFDEDHVPGAINLPVLDDAERAEIGTLYKQVDPFEARKQGAILVAKNISTHLQQHFLAKDRDYQPLIYCWRGGQRSFSMAVVLTEIGWRVTLLKGGYKTYRAWVRQQLLDLPTHFHYRILCGATGTGKTLLLRRLADQGCQVLDLEQLACHRGSLLGQEWQVPQPSQKWFETSLVDQLRQFDPKHGVWIESESSKVGDLHVPPVLWKQMQQAQRIEIQAPQAQRVQWLIQSYPHLIEHPEVLKQKLQMLKSRYGQARLQEWFDLIEAQQWPDLVASLLDHHYDPTYQHSLARSGDHVDHQVELADFSEPRIQSVLSILQQLPCQSNSVIQEGEFCEGKDTHLQGRPPQEMQVNK